MSQVENAPTPREIVESIRREEYMLGVEGSDSIQRGVKSLHQKLDRALRLLSEDLYSKETHFILELVQNADDNQYRSGVVPKLSIRVAPGKLVVSNNESGFAEKHVRALCSVGESSKGTAGGYIGEKGIGFKSVFTVSDAPEIHSNGYHFRFDRTVKDSLLGYVVPSWCEPKEEINTAVTTIVLPAKKGVLFDESMLVDLDAKLLLFLTKVRQLELVSPAGSKLFSRRDHTGLTTLGVEAKQTQGEITRSESHYVRTRHKVPMQDVAEEKRDGIEESEVVLAFPVDETGKASPEVGCATFAFLPIRAFGFSFCIQGDFLLSANREDVHTNRPWNLRLRDSIAPLFVASLKVFKATPELAFSYLKYLPAESDVTDSFFRPVVRQLVQLLGGAACLPGESGAWRKPAEMRIASKEFRELVPAKEALQLYEQDYPDSRLDVDEKTLVRLGCHTHSLADVIAIFTKHGEWLHAKDKDWLARFYAYLATRSLTKPSEDALRLSPCVPTADGRFVSPTTESVFFPLTSRKRYGFEHELSIIDEELLEKAANHSEKVRELFGRLGVKTAVPCELITSHILPLHAGESWMASEDGVLIGHVRYIKDKFDEYCSGALSQGVAIDKAVGMLREGLWLGTKHHEDENWVFGRGSSLYLSKAYAPEFCIETLLDGALDAEKLLAAEYLPTRAKKLDVSRATQEVASWRTFMMQLGVTDRPQVTHATDGDAVCSVELLRLLQSPSAVVRRAVLECLDRNWAFYAPHVLHVRVVGRSVVNTDSQFVVALRATLAPTPSRKKLVPLRDAYLQSPELRELFGERPTYVDATLGNLAFIQACHITSRADAAACIKRLRQLKGDGVATRGLLERIYRQMERLWDSEGAKIKQAFAQEELIYFKGEQSRWLRPEQAVWKSSGRFLDSLYPPLREQYGDFHSFYVKKLGIAGELPTAKMVTALRSLGQIEQVEEREQTALRIYRRASRELGGRFGQSPEFEPGWVDIFRSHAVFLDRRGQLVGKSSSLYIDDMPSRSTLFESADGVALLAVPFDEVPRLRPLFDAAELQYLSKSLVETVEGNVQGEVNAPLTAKLHGVVDYVARVVYVRFHEKFEAARDGGLFALLGRLEVVEVPFLQLRVTLGTETALAEGDIYTDGERILVRRGARALLDLVAMEICKLLQVPAEAADAITRLLYANDQVEAEDYLTVKNVSHLPAADVAMLSDADTILTTDEDEGSQQKEVEDDDEDATEDQSRERVPPLAAGTGKGSSGPTTPKADATPLLGAEAKPGHGASGALPTKPGLPAATPSATAEQVSAMGKERGSGSGSSTDMRPEPTPRPPTSTENARLANPSQSDRPAGTLPPVARPTPGRRGGATPPRRGRRGIAATKSGRLLSYADVATVDELRTRGPEEEDVVAARDEVAQAAVRYFLATLAGRWESLEEMPHNNPGFDVRAVARNGEQEVIEVKGQSGPWTEAGVALTRKELICAHEMRKRYWLCVVEYATDENRRRLHLVNDPFGCTQQFRFDSGWKSLATSEGAQPLKPAVGLTVDIQNEGSGVIISATQQGQFFKLHVHLSDGRQVFKTFNPATMKLANA